ncbi:MAG: TrkH family potassium uptake protein [Methanoregula sp.]|jgi:trk system potassium uptake protein TrkH|nr:TrkH family potassium uptake protein [Methanoregula sp.]
MKRTGHLAMIAHDMGLIFEFLGIVSLLPFIVLAIFGEWNLIGPMATAPITFLILGYLISHIPHEDLEPSSTMTLAAITLSWLAIAFIGALPFMYGLHMSFVDSVFEAMSGWTGTGFTMIASLDTTPKTLIFWRSFTHWIGGIGIIAFSISLRRKTRVSLFRMYKAEGRSDELLSANASTSRRMWMIYLVLTFTFTGLLMLADIPLWDALNLVMAAIATGGFTPHTGGIGYYNNPLLELLLIPVMITGALPFKFFLVMYHGKIRDMLRDRTVRALLFLALVGSLLVSLDLYLFLSIPLEEAFRQGTFTAISGLCTCGFQNSDLHIWATIPLALVAMMMFIGGAMGSASGGVKMNRVMLAYEGVRWWFRRFFVSGRVLVPLRFGGRTISREVSDLAISKNMLVIVIYVLTIFAATVLTLHLYITSFRMEEVIFELVSALSNAGLSVGLIGAASPITIKWIFIALMWLGRLEIVPVIIITMGLFKELENDSRSMNPPDKDFLNR